MTVRKGERAKERRLREEATRGLWKVVARKPDGRRIYYYWRRRNRDV